MKEVVITNVIRGMTKWFATADDKYTLWYESSTGNWGCSCRFSSWYRWCPKFKNTICRHALELIRMVKNEKE